MQTGDSTMPWQWHAEPGGSRRRRSRGARRAAARWPSSQGWWRTGSSTDSSRGAARAGAREPSPTSPETPAQPPPQFAAAAVAAAATAGAAVATTPPTNPWELAEARKRRVEDLKAALRAVPEAGDLAASLRDQLQEAEKAVEKHRPTGTQLDATRAYLTRAQRRAQLAVDHEVACQQALQAATAERFARQQEVRVTEQRIQTLEEAIATTAAPAQMPTSQPAAALPEAALLRRLLTQVQHRLQRPPLAPTREPRPPQDAGENQEAADDTNTELHARPDRERSPRRPGAATSTTSAGGMEAASQRGDDHLLAAVQQMLHRLQQTEAPGPPAPASSDDMEL